MRRILAPYAGLPTSIYILFVARVINCIGSFVFPFLTLFMTQKLGLAETTVGFFVMINSLAGIPGNLIGGALADRMGRKKIFVGSQALAALCLIPCAILGNSILIPWLLIFFAMFSNVSRPISNAMVADLTSGEQRQKAYSLLYLGINAGFSIGPVIAGLLFTKHIEWIFLGDAITTLLSLIPVMLFVKETMPSRDKIKESMKKHSREKGEEGNTLQVLLRRPMLLVFAFISSIFSFVYVQHVFSLPIHVNGIFSDKGPQYYGVLMMTNGLSVVFLTTLVTSLTKRFKPIFNIAAAGIFYAFGFGMLYFIHSYPLFILSTAIWTVGEILGATNINVYVAEHTPITHRGRFNAVLPFISGMGFTFGPAIMGVYIKSHGVEMVWPLTFALAVGGTLLMYLLHVSEVRKERQREAMTGPIGAVVE
jgi:MFS family permease